MLLSNLSVLQWSQCSPDSDYLSRRKEPIRSRATRMGFALHSFTFNPYDSTVVGVYTGFANKFGREYYPPKT